MTIERRVSLVGIPIKKEVVKEGSTESYPPLTNKSVRDRALSHGVEVNSADSVTIFNGRHELDDTQDNVNDPQLTNNRFLDITLVGDTINESKITFRRGLKTVKYKWKP